MVGANHSRFASIVHAAAILLFIVFLAATVTASAYSCYAYEHREALIEGKFYHMNMTDEEKAAWGESFYWVNKALLVLLLSSVTAVAQAVRYGLRERWGFMVAWTLLLASTLPGWWSILLLCGWQFTIEAM
jgi:hypothetical protein